MTERKLYFFREVPALVPVDEEFLLHCVESEWIVPADPEQPALDDADLARLRLIVELRETFGANEESLPLILHLLDQLHDLHARIEWGGGSKRISL